MHNGATSDSHLVFPERVSLNVTVWTRARITPYRGRPIAFRVRTFARAKNDYDLGPFFTDENGVLVVTQRQFELAAAAVLSTGIMDYVAVERSYSFVEIVHWSGEEIDRAIEARTTDWKGTLDGELELYGGVERLIEKFRSSGNASLRPAAERYGRLRDEWNGSGESVRTYEYHVQPKDS